MKKILFLSLLVFISPFVLAAEIITGSDFVLAREKGEPTQKTSFKIEADSQCIVVSVDCTDTNPEKLHASKASSLWKSDHVELFLSPDGNVQNYYQFMIPYHFDGRFNAYFAEKGNIQPDPYNPDWTASAQDTETGWRAIFRIPLSAFYMTRSAVWKKTWLVNVTRHSRIHSESSTWAKLPRGFHDPDKFEKVSGFPIREKEDDVAIESVSAEIDGYDGTNFVGMLKIGASSAIGARFDFHSPNASSTNVFINQIKRPFSVPCKFPCLGRNHTELSLVRGKSVYRRWFPVVVAYEPLKVRLTSPQYRDNFYPGQKTDVIAGEVVSSEKSEIFLSLSGDGISTIHKKMAGGGRFTFNVPDFTKGEMLLTVTCGENKVTKRIRKIEPNGRRMAWISNGVLMMDGKPLYRCGMGAEGYKGGKAFAKRYYADDTLGLDRDFCRGGRLEPSRLIPRGEEREAKKDIKPSKEMLEAVDRVMKSCEGKDFAWWYISDEPEMRGVSEVYLKHLYDYIREKDPYHIVRIASRDATKYIDCADWFEAHPYLDAYVDSEGERRYQMPMNKFGDYISCISDLHRPDKVIGTIPTCFSYKFNNPSSDYPTLDEYWCSTWAATIRGAKSSQPFFYADMGDRPWLYYGTAYLFHSYHALSDLLLFGKRTTLVKTDRHEAVLYSLENGEKLFIAVNFDRADKKLPIDLPGVFCEFRGDRFWKGTATLEMGPHEVIIATTSKRDAHLESQVDFRKRMDELEYERTHRDNQLFGRERSIQIKSCSPMGVLFNTGYKLVDGVRDVYAWSTRNAKDRYLELTFTDRAVAFNKLRLYGDSLDGVKIKARKNRKWVELKAKELQEGEFCKVFDFGEDVKTSKLRFEFANQVELYEIELPQTVASKKLTKNVGRAMPTENGVGWKLEGDELYIDTTKKAIVHRQCQSDTEYSWVEFRLDEVKERANPKWKYHAWEVKYAGRLAGEVNLIGTGLYTAYRPADKASKKTITFVGYNEDLRFGFFQFVKEPRNRLRAWSPEGEKVIGKGDVLKVELNLDEPCEDVNCVITTFGRRAKKPHINNRNAIELKPLDETMKRWGASIVVDSATSFKQGDLRLCCAILGGSLKDSISTTIECGMEIQ